MLRLTLDHCCLIHAVNQAPVHGPEVEELLALADEGQVDVAVTSAFHYEKKPADREKERRLAEYVAARPCLAGPPLGAPFTLGVSELGSGDFLSDDEGVAAAVKAIVMPGADPAAWVDDSAENLTRQRRKYLDCHHLLAHHHAGRDLFVTTDKDHILNRRVQLEAFGIVVVCPSEALAQVRR